MGGDGETNDWQIKESELELDARIGMGSFGEVYKGSWRGTDVAVKRILEQDFTEQHMKVGSQLWQASLRMFAETRGLHLVAYLKIVHCLAAFMTQHYHDGMASL